MTVLKNPLVIIPAYNLENAIGKMIEETLKFTNKENILVVDDGSSDATHSKASEYGVITLKHQANSGKSSAIKNGFAYFLDNEQFDCVITIDGDLQHPPELIPPILAELNKGFDLVMGNRMSKTDKMPPHRIFSNRLSSWGISVVLGEKLPDTQCGFRIHRRWVIEKIVLKSQNYAIETEVALQAGLMGAKFGHLDIPTIYNGSESYIRPIRATLRITRLILKYLFKSRKRKT